MSWVEEGMRMRNNPKLFKNLKATRFKTKYIYD